jgi:hypothetical protein
MYIAISIFVSNRLESAFNYRDLVPCELLLDAPPVARILLRSNPLHWTAK